MHLAFHATMKRKQPGWEHPLSCTFDRIGWLVKTLQAAGYTIVTCSEYAQRRDESRLLATLSFDDGYLKNQRAAKTLEVFGVRGTFFPIACTLRGELPPNRRLGMAIEKHGDHIIGDWFYSQLKGTDLGELILDEAWESPGPFRGDHGLRKRMKTIWNCMLTREDVLYLSNALHHQFLEDIHERAACEEVFLQGDELKALTAAGHEVGTHTEHHLFLHSQCTGNVRREIMGSIDILTDVLRVPITSLCLPYGGDRVPNHLIDTANEFGLSGYNYCEYAAYKDPIVSDLGYGFFNRNDHKFFQEALKAAS